MPIINLTHERDGGVRLRRSVTIKVAIGAPPEPGKPFPKKLDHFIFQRKGEAKDGGKTVVAWNVDEAMMRHYGKGCQKVGIVLLDDDADVAFRTELAWWSKTARVCHGDGDKAVRRTEKAPKGEAWSPCMNAGCVDFAEGRCKPSGDLYFLLEEFPSLGTVCKLHTSSYQSITEIRSALEDLRTVTGGRLMGVRASLTVRLEKNVYTDKQGKLISTTKNILGLELSGSSLRALTDGMTDAAMVFQDVKKRLGARSITVVEDDDEAVAPTLNAEFYPAAERLSPSTQTNPDIDDSDLPPEMFAQGEEALDMTPISPEEVMMINRMRKEGRRKPNRDETIAYIRDTHGIADLRLLPKHALPAVLRWCNGDDLVEQAEAAPAQLEAVPADTSEDERQAREGFGFLGLTLPQRNQLIDEMRGDWKAIRAEVNYMLDQGEADVD